MARSEEDELFWSGFCTMLPIWAILFGVNVVAAFMIGFSFLFLESGSPSYVVAVLDVGMLSVSFVVLAVAIRKCGRRQQNEYRR